MSPSQRFPITHAELNLICDLQGSATLMSAALYGPAGAMAGIDKIEQCLAKASQRDPGERPAPLTENMARHWHLAQRTAYNHALEMLSPDWLKELKATIKPSEDGETPTQRIERLMHNVGQLVESLFGQFGVASGIDVLQRNLATAKKADPQEAPVPLVDEEAATYHAASAAAYERVLELVNAPIVVWMRAGWNGQAARAEECADEDEASPAPAA